MRNSISVNNSGNDDYNLVLYDISGNEVASTKTNSGQCEISNIEHGIYMLHLYNANFDETKKIIIN
jgi:hypothetical protein